MTKFISYNKDDISNLIKSKKDKVKVLKQFSHLTVKHGKLVDETFKKLSKNYLLILKYLKKDFSVKRFDGEDINDEIAVIKTLYKDFKSGTKFRPTKKAQKIKYINDYLKNYPKLLKEIKRHSGDDVSYKDINFVNEEILLNQAEKLRFDFSPYLKKNDNK